MVVLGHDVTSRTSPGGPARHGLDPAGVGNQPGRQPLGGQPAGGDLAPDDGRGAGRVGVGAGGCGDRARPPDRGRGQPGARVQDVVQHAAAPAPAPGGGARGGQAAADDGHGYRGAAGILVRAAGDVLDPDTPAAVGGRAGHRDVSAQPDQDTAVQGGADPGG